VSAVRAEILTIGDELLRGEIVDSNKSLLAERLLRLDVETRFQTSVADDPDDMVDAFRRAADRSRVVLVSGGLGPTRDDLTFEMLARAFGRRLVLHEPSLEAIRSFFARFGREMAPNNEKQAWLPEGSEALPNPIGTAPGCMLEVQAAASGGAQRGAAERSISAVAAASGGAQRGAAERSPGGTGDALFFCMPGVPRELERMMDEQVLPRLGERLAAAGQHGVVRALLLRTFGMGESNLDEALRDVAKEDDVVLGFRTAFPDNYLRPVARGRSAAEAEARLARVCATIRERLGVLIYAEGDETLEQVVGRLLRERRLTVALAESCTGGLLAERISSVPGASDYLRGGVVAYANEAKTALLGVPEALLREHGAVSEPVARAMAAGARERFGADLAVATTGISGPGGGSAEKPVGLVWVAVAREGGCEARDFVFPFDRPRHRLVTAQLALDWLRRLLLGEVPIAPRYLERPRTPGFGERR
jgi:nicotinamide-nucleotide amidase